MSMSTSTSPSNTQQGRQNLEHNSESVKSSGAYKSNTQTSTNATDDVHGQNNSQKTSSRDESKKARRSNISSEPKDLYEFPGSSPSEYNPAAEMGDMRSRRAGSRTAVKEGPAPKTAAMKAKRKTTLRDTNEEEKDVWQPSRGSKVLEEPSKPRATRQQGSAGLVDGLKNRKRRGRATEIDSGSATEASLVSKRRKKDAPSRRGGPRSSSSILVDLAKSDNILSDSQKQQYEYISIESSLECPPPLPYNSQHSLVNSVADDRDLARSNTDITPAQDSADLEDSTIVAQVTPQRAKVRNVSGTRDSATKAISSLVIELQSSAPEPSPKEKRADPSSADVQGSRSFADPRHLPGKSGEDAQPTHEKKKHTIVMSESKSKKAKKSSSRKGSNNPQPVIDEDESEAEKFGLPPERYKPRLSRSRAKHIIEETPGSEIPDVNMGNPAEADEEKAPVLPPSPRKRRKKSRRKQSTTTEPRPPSTDQQSKAEDDAVKDTDEPLQGVDNNEVHSKLSPNSETVAPTTPAAKSPKPDNSANDDTIANGTTAATSLPSPRSPEKPRTTATKPPHSPLSNGRVPYRVGLSKRVKIQPLLRTMKR